MGLDWDQAEQNKMEGLVSSDQKLKEYMKSKSLHDVKGIFLSRSQLVKGVKGNNKAMMHCTAYRGWRQDKDLGKDKDRTTWM